MIETVQQYIADNGIESLTEEFGIKVKEYEHLYVLNYDQINSPKNQPIPDACRALILYKDDLSIATRSFKRFFNYGECDQVVDNWEHYDVLSKEDGSHISFWHDRVLNKWQISTRGTAFAESPMGNQVTTFREGVLQSLGLTEDQFQELMEANMSKTLCTTFEYVGPENRIVTRYTESKLFLLAQFDKELNIELSNPFDVSFLGNVHPVRSWKVSSKEALDMISDTLDELEEGFVLVNRKNQHRVKVKRGSYLIIHRLAGNGIPSVDDVVELYLENEQAEILAYYPEFKNHFDKINSVIESLYKEGESLYNEHQSIESQKDFAIKVKDHPLSAVCFSARNKKISFHDAFYSSMKATALSKLVKEKL